jgi:hypothetical protein
MVPWAPLVVTPPPVLRSDWETLALLASTRSKSLDLNACPTSSPSCWFLAQQTNRNPLGFEAQTKKLVWWFWGPNHQIIAAGFEAQTGKPSTTLILRLKQKNLPPILRPNRKKPSSPILRSNQRKSSPPVLRSNRRKPSPPVLRPNQRKPFQWFLGQTTNKPS